RHPKGSILPLPTVLSYTRQLASALDYAHTQKIIHRDVKPENILIGQQGQLMLSDFGVASTVHSSRSQTMAEIAGTISYIAPEQIQGRPRLASDQYALGIIVYEWLSGSCPFQGTITEMVTQHLATLPPSLQDKISNLPPAVEQVIFTALAKDPAQRFANLQAFANAFEQACRDTQTSAALNLAGSLEDSTQPAPPSTAAQVSTAPLQSGAQNVSSFNGIVEPVLLDSTSVPPTIPVEQNPPAATPLSTPIAHVPLLAAHAPSSPLLNTPTPSTLSSFLLPSSFATLGRRNMLIASSALFVLIVLIIGSTLYARAYFNHPSISSSNTPHSSERIGKTLSSTDSTGHLLTPLSGTSTSQGSPQSQGGRPASSGVTVNSGTTSIATTSAATTSSSTSAATTHTTGATTNQNTGTTQTTDTAAAQATTAAQATADARATSVAQANANAQATATENSCNTHDSTSNPVYQGSGYVYSNGGYYMTKGPYCNGNIYIAFTSAPPVSDTQVRVCTASGTCYAWHTYAGVGAKMTVATGVATGTSFHLQFQGRNATASETVNVTVYF
ncbi:MAG TPA: serine/threonine-protein kinase, partial [Ktedonobacteraceae bacterium]|nr:serine/threonine-protein kinase [Ktedonobacteraceae bacterium]